MFRTAGKPRVAQPPQRDNVVADPISLTLPCGCTCPREKRRRRGAQCAPGGRLAAAPTEDMEHGTWGAAGHQAADFGLETAVGKCFLLRTWFQAGVSAALAHAAGAVPSWTAGAHCAPLRKDGCGEKKHAPGGRLAAAPTKGRDDCAVLLLPDPLPGAAILRPPPAAGKGRTGARRRQAGRAPAARHKKFTITRLKKTAQYGKVVT